MPARTAVPLLLLLLLLSRVSLAAAEERDADGDGDPDNWCRNGAFPGYGGFRIGRIARPLAVVYGDDDDCPTRGDCIEARLHDGDEVIVARTLGDLSCVWHFPDDQDADEIVGWVATTAIELAPASRRRSLADWTGTWRAWRDEIRISRSRDALVATGTAVWQGYGDNTHEGAFTGTARPEHHHASFVDEDDSACEVELTRVGRYLVVHDNRGCGGVNVSFDGVYRR